MIKTPRAHHFGAFLEMLYNIKGIIHLPTGTGKSFIQAMIIMHFVKMKNWKKGKPPVFIIISPRILLATQLFEEMRMTMYENKLDCQYLVVHSGSISERTEFKEMCDAIRKDEAIDKIPYRSVESTTSNRGIKEEYERACSENVPLIISSTYDSAKRIKEAGIPIEIINCDEAHYLLRPEFQWICEEFPCNRKYFFTATLRETESDQGAGMNNEDRFGKRLFHRTPLEMIIAGEILRPRLHIVDVDMTSLNNPSELDIEVNSIVSAFRAHKSAVKIGAKMLVATSGSERLNDTVNHPIMQRLMKIGVKIFDITSQHKARINGKIVPRSRFLEELQNLREDEDAIIFHIRILTEGIDVPGITGVMFLQMPDSLAVFLQMLGRGTRLNKEDRRRLYNFIMGINELDNYLKPYAYVIVPVCGAMGQDRRESIEKIIYRLRDYGFKAAEHVVITDSHGTFIEPGQEGLNELPKTAKRYRDEVIEMDNIIEDKRIADIFDAEISDIYTQTRNMTKEQLKKSFSEF